MSKKVICHITGPSGSGKTTLLEKIQKMIPSVSTLDLDELDEQASVIMGYEHRWKDSSYTDEKLLNVHNIRQTLLDVFISNHKNVVLGGHHLEGETEYSFDSKQNFILDVSKDIIQGRKMKRDSQTQEEFEQQFEDEKEIFDSLSDTYKRASPKEILLFISKNLE
jgi:uridine kinase